MTDKNDKCDVCRGTGKVINECPFCNGTGEWNSPGAAYFKNHICQCINWDRKFCPICSQKCHHDTSGKAKAVINSGDGGETVSRNWDKAEKDIEQEMGNYA